MHFIVVPLLLLLGCAVSDASWANRQIYPESCTNYCTYASAWLEDACYLGGVKYECSYGQFQAKTCSNNQLTSSFTLNYCLHGSTTSTYGSCDQQPMRAHVPYLWANTVGSNCVNNWQDSWTIGQCSQSNFNAIYNCINETYISITSYDSCYPVIGNITGYAEYPLNVCVSTGYSTQTFYDEGFCKNYTLYPPPTPAPTPAPTPSPTPTPTPAATPSPTPTPSPTTTPSPSPTPAATPSPTPSPTPTPAATPSPTSTPTPAATPSPTPSPTPGATPAATPSPPGATPSPTPSPTPAATPSPTPAATPAPTSTPGPSTPAPTNAPTSAPTSASTSTTPATSASTSASTSITSTTAKSLTSSTSSSTTAAPSTTSTSSPSNPPTASPTTTSNSTNTTGTASTSTGASTTTKSSSTTTKSTSTIGTPIVSTTGDGSKVTIVITIPLTGDMSTANEFIDDLKSIFATMFGVDVSQIDITFEPATISFFDVQLQMFFYRMYSSKRSASTFNMVVSLVVPSDSPLTDTNKVATTTNQALNTASSPLSTELSSSSLTASSASVSSYSGTPTDAPSGSGDKSFFDKTSPASSLSNRVFIAIIVPCGAVALAGIIIASVFMARKKKGAAYRKY